LVGNGVLGALVHELAAAESGDRFARRAVDAVVDEWDLDDALLVLDDGTAYRAGGRPIDEFTGIEDPRRPSLRAVPDRVPEDVATAVANLCVVAHRVEQLTHDASHDALTGLLNRRSFGKELAQAVAGAERYGWSCAVVIIDLDGLKAINDEHGHVVGDAVLRTVGSELTDSVRTADVAARLGGDEFALIVMEADAAHVAELLSRVTAAVNQSLTGLTVTLSSGTAMVPADGTDPGELYRLADERLYTSRRG
jgi:diguanylate cyclase (GGDEF)-like protein